jgi:hypothetical protein
MSTPGTFSLLYEIQVKGLDALDGVTRSQQKVNLETKYGQEALAKFDIQLGRLKESGISARDAVNLLAKANNEMAKDLLANDRLIQQSSKETARIRSEANRQILQSNRGVANVTASALGMSGGGIGQSLGAFAGGMSGGGAMLGIAGVAAAGAAITAGITSIFDITKQTAEFAQRQQNLATKMGGTTDQSQMFTRTSQVLGLNPEAATTAMRGLVRAIADGGEESKRGEQALKALGVSATALGNGLISPATALEQMISKLKDIKDPLEKSRIALDLFNRTGLNLLPLVDGFDALGNKIRDTGVIMDTDAIQKMADYNKQVELLGLRWEALKEKLALGVVATIKFLVPTALGQPQTNVGKAVRGFFEGAVPVLGTALAWKDAKDEYGDPGPPDVSGVTGKNSPNGNFFFDQTFAKNKASASALLRSIDPKAAKAREMSDAQGDLSLAYNDRQKAITAAQRGDAESRMRDAASRIAALSEKATGGIDKLSNALAALNERAQTAGLGPLGTLAREQMAFNREYSPTGAGAASANAAFGELRMAQIQRYIREAGAAAGRTANQNEGELSRRSREYRLTSDGTPFGRPLSEVDAENRAEISTGRELIGLSNRSQQGFIQRSKSRAGDDVSPNAAYADQIDVAQRLYALDMQNAQLEEDAGRRKIEQARAYYDLVQTEDEARIERENKIAEIGKQQKEETRNFSEGLFGAGMSGQSSAVSNYLRGFGMNLATKAIGNASDAILPSFNSIFSAGKTGALGTPDKPSFLGKLAKGTPFDWSAEDLKKQSDAASIKLEAAKDQPLITSQDLLRTSIDTLTATIGGKPPSGTSASGTVVGASAGGSIFGSLSRMLGAPGGTAPFLSSSSTSGTSGLFGGGSGSGLIQDGISIPLSMLAGHSADVSAMADMVATQSIPVAGGYSLAGTSSFGIPNGGGSIASGSTGSTVGKFASGIGQLLGGARYALTGHGLQGVFTGKQDNGDGTGEALSGLGRVGEAAGLAGGAYAGISGAISGFGQGGGRGITKGLASSLGAASLFDGPLAPFTSAAAGILGIASSLFGDPVAERQKHIDQTLTNQQYIEPNQHNYSYSAGGGGVDFGANGMMRSGAQQAGYTVNVSAMDAASLYSTIQRNSQAFGSNLSQSLGSSGVGALASEVSWHALHP